MTRRVFGLATSALALALLLPPTTALAWDAAAHKAILEMALLLSPAAATRLPAEYREDLFKELQTPDSRDTLCRYHRGPLARTDAFAEAERELAWLTQAGAAAKPYPRAKAIGRYLHWVADGVVPPPIASGKVCEVMDFWGNKDFVVFRERSPLTGPLSTSLKARSEAAVWADDTAESMPAVLRLAVNTTVEALLLLPPIPGVPAAPDEGSVVFLVNRIDNGLSANTSTYYYYEAVYGGGGVYVGESGIAEVRSGGQGKKKANLMQREQVQIAEQSVKTRPGGGLSIRALVFNNLAVPACDVGLRWESWHVSLSGTLPPGGLRLATFDVPPGVDLPRATLVSRSAGCPSTIGEGVVRSDRRVVLGSTGAVPGFKAEESTTALGGPVESAATSAPGRAPVTAARPAAAADGAAGRRENSRVVVGLRPAAEYGAAAPVEVLSMEVVPGPWDWQVTVTVRNPARVQPGQVRLVVARPENAAVREVIWVDVRKMAPGATQTFVLNHRPRQSGVPERLGLVEILASS